MAQDSVRVEIFDQAYNLRGTDAAHITRLAEYVDGKIRAIAQHTQTVDSVRLAVLAAVNIADELLLLKKKHENVAAEYCGRAQELSAQLDEALETVRLAG